MRVCVYVFTNFPTVMVISINNDEINSRCWCSLDPYHHHIVTVVAHGVVWVHARRLRGFFRVSLIKVVSGSMDPHYFKVIGNYYPCINYSIFISCSLRTVYLLLRI